MLAIYFKEINEFLNSLIAYIVIGVFLIATGLIVWVFPSTNVLDYGYATLDTFFSQAPFVLMFLIPAITMKSFAEEKRNGTIELLYTLPFRDHSIIFGKFLAGFTLVILSVLPTLVYYFSIHYLGHPVGNIDTAGAIGSYIGLLLLGAVFTSIGIFASALTGNQIVSFILAAFLCFVLYAGFDALASINIWSKTSYLVKNLGLLSHYQSLGKGLIDFADVVYLLSVVVVMLVLTKISLNRK